MLIFSINGQTGQANGKHAKLNCNTAIIALYLSNVTYNMRKLSR